jgi:hypothetical protein
MNKADKLKDEKAGGWLSPSLSGVDVDGDHDNGSEKWKGR